MELRTQTNGTRFVKERYNALGSDPKLPFFSAIYIPQNGTRLKNLFLVAKDENGEYAEYDYKAGFEDIFNGSIPCASNLKSVEDLPAGIWIYAPTGFEFSYIDMESGFAVIY
jgi:hypothetical protein